MSYHTFGQKSGFGKRAAVLLAATLLLAACGDGTADKNEEGKALGGLPSAAETQIVVDQAMAASGTWGDITYGDPNAPVEIIEYASLTCPHCADFAKKIFPEIEEKYIKTGKAKLVYRNFLMNRIDLAASAVARCGDMDTTKKLMKIYFARQRDWAGSEKPQDELAAIARRVGISRTEFDKCLSNTAMHEHLAEMTKIASEKFEVNSTPSLFANGKRLEFSTYDDLKENIAKAVEGAN